MIYWLFFLFTALPLLELALLIYIGSKTSVLFTIGMVLAAGFVGALLARWQGWRALERIRAESEAGRIPSESLFDGFLILVAGIFLIMPGVLSDVLGLLLLIPWCRRAIRRYFVYRLGAHIKSRGSIIQGRSWHPMPPVTVSSPPTEDDD